MLLMRDPSPESRADGDRKIDKRQRLDSKDSSRWLHGQVHLEILV